MKISLNNMHNPCMLCSLRDIPFDPVSSPCLSCEYDIAIKVLKSMLKEELYCSVCKNSKSLGGGYYECSKGYDEDGFCKKGENLDIDWEIACGEYGIETV